MSENTHNPSPSPFVTRITVHRTWNVLPGAILVLHLRLILSSEVAASREAGLVMTPGEKQAALTDFRIRMLADVLADEPEGFPGFPAPNKEQSLAERAYTYFAQKDEAGRFIFGLFVEDVINEFWRKALPGDYFPTLTDSSEQSSTLSPETSTATPG